MYSSFVPISVVVKAQECFSCTLEMHLVRLDRLDHQSTNMEPSQYCHTVIHTSHIFSSEATK